MTGRHQGRPDGMLRAFLAVPLPEDVRGALVEARNRLDRIGAKVSWVRPENLHLTLVFLGDIPERRLPAVQRVVEEVAPRYAPIDLEAHGLGYFGSARSPRVIWAGFNTMSPALTEMHGLLVEGFRGIGFDVERRAFKPHLTLGRVRSAQKADALTSAVGSVNNTDFGAVPVNRIQVLRSDLSPRGARHMVLQEVMLKGATDDAP